MLSHLPQTPLVIDMPNQQHNLAPVEGELVLVLRREGEERPPVGADAGVLGRVGRMGRFRRGR